MPILKIKNSSYLGINVKSSFSIFTECYNGIGIKANFFFEDRNEIFKPHLALAVLVIPNHY